MIYTRNLALQTKKTIPLVRDGDDCIVLDLQQCFVKTVAGYLLETHMAVK